MLLLVQTNENIQKVKQADQQQQFWEQLPYLDKYTSYLCTENSNNKNKF